jgi:DNA-binding LacI/PurR family transcriptional regulator
MSVVRAITIRDVAKKANVSLSTVSQVLNGRPGYASPATRDRVLAAARELGYRPNALARGLVTSRTGTLGVVITDITRAFFTQVVGSIEQVASAQGYSVLLACAAGVRAEQRALETFIDKRVDGIICMSSTASTSADHILQVTRLGIPLVMINRPLHTAELNQIAWDDVEIGQRAMEHLIGLGHRRIVVIDGRVPGKPDHGVWENRTQGLRAALQTAGLDLAPTDVVPAGDCHPAEGAQAMTELLDRPGPRPTAVFCHTDELAFGASAVLRRRGIHCPTDISIAGFDDHPMAQYWGLTTVSQHAFSQGMRAAHALVDALETEEPIRRATEDLPVELMVRETTGPI